MLNDALRKAIQSTANNPAQATFLESILKQIDVARFAQDQQDIKCVGPSIPTPNVVGRCLGSSISLFELEDDDEEMLVN